MASQALYYGIFLALMVAAAYADAIQGRELLQSACSKICAGVKRNDPESFRNVVGPNTCNCVCNRVGQGPLRIAAVNGCGLCISLLTTAPANCPCVAEPAFFGVTPLHSAAGVCNGPTTSDLINAGCNVNAKTRNGDTPLCQASRRNNDDNCGQVVRTLLAKGAAPCILCSDGKTAFEGCVYQNTCNVLKDDGAGECP